MMDRTAFIIEDTTPINAVVLAEGAKGDEWLEANPNAVEVTGLDPMPGVGNGWAYVEGAWIAPEPQPMTHEQVEQKRQAAYAQTADPLFFQVQRGEATEQEWLDAVQAVKTAQPYPTQPKK